MCHSELQRELTRVMSLRANSELPHSDATTFLVTSTLICGVSFETSSNHNSVLQEALMSGLINSELVGRQHLSVSDHLFWH
jgi:hypothetical protein